MSDPKKALETASSEKQGMSSKVTDLNVKYLGADKVDLEEHKRREKELAD